MKRKLLLSLIIIFFISSCANEPKEIKPQKEVKISADPKKIEVTLYKGGVITFTGSDNLKPYFVNKHLWEEVTVYRKIQDKIHGWKVDQLLPQKSIDTTLLLYEGSSLLKIQYRQGFISKIFEQYIINLNPPFFTEFFY